MKDSKDGKPRLSIGFFDYGKAGWTSDKTGKYYEPTYNYPLPFDGPKPRTEQTF
jgi:hypothetical protein